MKPYGLRPGDGQKSNRHQGFNKFARTHDRGGPIGKNKESKIHRQRKLVHKQGRQDGKNIIRKAVEDMDNG